MQTVLVQGWVVRPLFTYLIALPAVVAVIAFVAVGVNLWNGEEQLPAGIWAATPWFAGCGLVFTAVTALVAWRGAIRVRLVSMPDGERLLEIADPKGPILVPNPMTCRYGYHRQHVQQAGKQTVLLAGVFHEGACRVAFQETWGTAYSPPDDWPAEPPRLEAPVLYDTLAGSFVAELVAVIESEAPKAG